MGEDRIRITGVEAFGYHGVLPRERATGQRFIVDIELTLDVSAAATSDDLTRTVDYSAVAQLAADVVTGEPRDLIETVAVEIAERVMEHSLIDQAQVTLHKPDAPIDLPFSDVSVAVVRRR